MKAKAQLGAQWFCWLITHWSLTLTHPLHHQGRSKVENSTHSHTEWPVTASAGHWIQYSNAYCFSRRSWIQRQKESTMLMRGTKYPELRFTRPNSQRWHFPRTTTIPEGVADNSCNPSGLSRFLKSAASFCSWISFYYESLKCWETCSYTL